MTYNQFIGLVAVAIGIYIAGWAIVDPGFDLIHAIGGGMLIRAGYERATETTP